MGIGQIFTDFAGWTSAHGIPHIGSANNAILKAFWAMLTFVSAVLFTYQMYTLVTKYFSYHTSIQTELHFEKRIFPAITICPLNPVRRSALRSNSGYQQAIDVFDHHRHTDIMNAELEYEELQLALATTRMLNFNYEYHLANDAAPDIAADNATLEDYTYAYDDMFLTCTDFTYLFDASYGICWTFNRDKDPENNNRTDYYDSTRAGPLYGLRVLIRVHQEDYLPFIPSAGVRVAVHYQDADPFISAFGFNAAPGFANTYGIRYVETKRLGEPYGVCTNEIIDKGHYYFPGNYTAEGCYRSCLQNEIYRVCECYDPTLGHAAEEDLTHSCSYGTVTEMQKHIECQDNAKKDFNVIDQCHCPLACFEESYNVIISTAMWPSEIYTYSSQAAECNNRNYTLKYWKTIDACRTWYKLNTLLVEAYYEKLNYQIVKEVADYNWVLFISEAGGQLGLFLGVSFITCVEIISVAFITICYCLNKKEMPNEVDQAKDMDTSDSHSSESSSDDDPYGAADDDDGGEPPHIAE